MRNSMGTVRAAVVVGAWLIIGSCSSSSSVDSSAATAKSQLSPAPRYDASTLRRLAAKRPAAAARLYDEMSTMGGIAAGIAPPESLPPRTLAPRLMTPDVIGGPDVITHSLTAPGTQGETTIAANANTTVLIVGYNDARGFATTPVSLSGVARSTDGGATWAEVPVGPGGAGTLPSVTNGQVFGDPDVKYDVVNDRFVYSSIFVRPSDGRQGLCIHVSNSGASAGTVWNGPIEITPAFSAAGSADKEFIDVNPVTGRILVTWTFFPSAGSASILSTFSDDGGATWSAPVTIETAPAGGSVQASEPRFLPGTTNASSTVYAVWRNGAPTTALRNLRCSRSSDGGATWSAPVDLDSQSYAFEDQIQGLDRINTSPSMAVDYGTGRVFVAYQRNSAVGTGDIALRTFVGACATAAPLLLNADPGNDRAQFYPFVTVDQSTHRAHVAFYDQIGPGDLADVRHTFSTDQGATWSPPTPLTDRPFHLGYGNDTGQPNLGDYNQAVAQGGKLYSTFAATSVAPTFDEGQPATQLITPDTYFDVTGDAQTIAPLRLVGAITADSACAARGNGNIDPGEPISLTVTLENYVLNPAVGAGTVSNIAATLTTTTPGVTVTMGSATYGNLTAGASEAGNSPFVFTTSSGFVPGTYIDFLVSVSSAQGSIDLPLRLATGTPGTVQTLLSENFDAVVSGLPAGWSSLVAGGTGQTAWSVATTISASKAAFHDEAEAIGFVRLLSPVLPVPASATPAYVTVDFDLTYNLEDEPTQLVQAYDGLTLRITDMTAGATLRSVLAEAFAEEIKSGTIAHFPKHLPRNSSTAYFQDMSVWSGSSNGVQHVSMKLPGTGLVGRSIQLRFEYTQDTIGVCAAGTCGVAVDNVEVKLVPASSASCLADLAITKSDAPDPVAVGGTLTYDLDVSNNGPGAADNLVVTDVLPAGVTFVSASGTGWSCGNAAGTVTCTRASLAAAASAPLSITVTAPLTGGSISNTATVASAQPDPNPSNNSATATTSVLMPVVCGDGQIGAGEQCDDGNTTANDCCSPTCQFESTSTVCRPAAGACDVADTCNGAGQCAADGKASDGTPCPNSTVCDGAEVCMAGACTAGTALNCDDGNSCTQDSCDATSGCQHVGACGPDMAGMGGGADMSGGGADMSGGGGGADMSGGGGGADMTGGGGAPDMSHGGGGSGCSCDVGGARSNPAPALFATSLLVGVFGWRRRRRNRV